MEKVEYKGFEIEVSKDTHAESPRRWDGSPFKMVCAHGEYSLGDEQYKASNSNNWREHIAEYFMDNYTPWGWSYDTYEKDVDRAWKWIEKNVILQNLYLYDHSGITMSTGVFSCRWDSGQVEFIYITKKDAIENWGKKIMTKALREKVILYLEGDVEAYDNYLTGNIYGYNIESEDDNFEDSCWGYYGSDHEKSGLLENARGVIDWYLKDKEEKRVTKLKTLIRNRVPLANRVNYQSI